MMNIEIYRGYGIDFNIYGMNEYSVQYDGDDVMFEDIETARLFIDDILDTHNEQNYSVVLGVVLDDGDEDIQEVATCDTESECVAIIKETLTSLMDKAKASWDGSPTPEQIDAWNKMIESTFCEFLDNEDPYAGFSLDDNELQAIGWAEISKVYVVNGEEYDSIIDATGRVAELAPEDYSYSFEEQALIDFESGNSRTVDGLSWCVKAKDFNNTSWR